jgi:hypothetical protein
LPMQMASLDVELRGRLGNFINHAPWSKHSLERVILLLMT